MESMESAAQLVHAAAKGDQAAWDALVDRYTGLCWSIARSHRLSPADAADAVQTAWLRLVERLDTLRDPERVGAWLATTTRNECLRVIRRSSRQVPTGEDAWLESSEPVDPPDLTVLASEEAVELWQAVDGLPDRCRQLLRVLMADPPPSYEDVSAALEMPVGSIGPTRARCLERLRDQLDLSDVGDAT